MTALAAKTLEIAIEAFELTPADESLAYALSQAIAATDLVEREDYDDLQDNLRSRHDLHIRTLAGRDEARREAEELRGDRDGLKHMYDTFRKNLEKREAVVETLAETRGKQIAALREALTDIAEAKHTNATLMQKTAEIVLTDTAAAAAQWVRVDDEHVVIEAAALEPFIKYIKSSDGPVTQFYDHGKSETGPGISADVPDDFVLSKPSPEIHAITLGHFRALLAAAPQAGEGYRERYKRELLAAHPAKPEPEDGG